MRPFLHSRAGLWLAAFLLKAGLVAVFILPRLDGWEKRLSYPGYEEAILHEPAHYDDMGYMEIARRLASEGEYLSPYYSVPTPQMHRTPGYPAILAVLGTATGWNLLLMLLIQAAVLSWIPVVFRDILKSAGWPLWVAWGLVADPLVNLVSVSFMTEGWLILLLLLAVLCWMQGGRLLNRFLAFTALGAAILVKPTPQFFFVVFVAASLVLLRGRMATLLAAAAGASVVALWMLRNFLLCGLFAISTQGDGIIAVKMILESKKTGVSVDQLMNERSQKDGESIQLRVTDNKFDFQEETREYLRENKLLFIKYHALGAVRVLLGTGREHFKQVFWEGTKPPRWVAQIYDVSVMAYYLGLYAAVLGVAGPLFLKHRLSVLSLLFIGYNMALIGVFAYLVGGGLKRVVFVPFLLLLLAHGWHGLKDGCKRRRFLAKISGGLIPAF